MRGRDLTPEQIDNLIRAYVAGGLKGSEKLAVEYDVGRKYPAVLARGLGLRHGPVPPTRKHTMPEEDRRWGWAKERGAVTA